MTQPKASFPEVADQFETVADEWLSGGGGPGAPEFLGPSPDADLVVLNGEGSLYRENLSADSGALPGLAVERTPRHPHGLRQRHGAPH